MQEATFIQIEFIDKSGALTTDYVLGDPTVWVEGRVQILSMDDPEEGIQLRSFRERALVDTGANHTVLDRSLVAGMTPLRKVSARNVLGPAPDADVHRLVLGISGLDFIKTEVAADDLIAKGVPTPIILGRDLLSKYSLIYDTPRRIFGIERSPSAGTPPTR